MQSTTSTVASPAPAAVARPTLRERARAISEINYQLASRLTCPTCGRYACFPGCGTL